jgi:hypothetical protein
MSEPATSLAQSHAIFIGLAGLSMAADDTDGLLRIVSGLVAALGALLCLIRILIGSRKERFIYPLTDA